MSEILSPPPPGYRSRTVCTRCDNTGAIVELRVIWKQPRPDLPPLRGSRRVENEDEGRAVMDEACAAGYIDIDIVSAARPCECRKRREDPPRQPGRPKGAHERGWKSRASGEHEEEYWWNRVSE